MTNETKVCRDISALSPVAQRACRAFLRECEKEGMSVLITETYRSQVRQDYLYAQGEPEQGRLSLGHETAAIQGGWHGISVKM